MLLVLVDDIDPLAIDRADGAVVHVHDFEPLVIDRADGAVVTSMTSSPSSSMLIYSKKGETAPRFLFPAALDVSSDLATATIIIASRQIPAGIVAILHSFGLLAALAEEVGLDLSPTYLAFALSRRARIFQLADTSAP